MNARAPLHISASSRRFRVVRTSRIERVLRWPADAFVGYITRQRMRRTLRRWITPEAERAYNAGKNTGAMLGILYCTFIGMLLVAGLLLAGRGQ